MEFPGELFPITQYIFRSFPEIYFEWFSWLRLKIAPVDVRLTMLGIYSDNFSAPSLCALIMRYYREFGRVSEIRLPTESERIDNSAI